VRTWNASQHERTTAPQPGTSSVEARAAIEPKKLPGHFEPVDDRDDHVARPLAIGDERHGAFQVMGPAVGGRQGATGGSVSLAPTVVDVRSERPTTVFEGESVVVTAVGIPHLVPTLAYRVRVGGVSVVFSSDQNGSNPKFAEFAKDADLLVMHLQLGVDGSNPGHATPTVVGQVASAAHAKRLVVAHIGQFDVDAAVAEVKRWYGGPLTVGSDLQCVAVR